ncbi:hypothetical protein ABIB25_003614 [Nakamurella sp. UYEF19]|uniref:MFS transporter n=1 Tax=Nakamurella sp. UYEF19 TaxID=1756392 RepID=UPI00339A4384
MIGVVARPGSVLTAAPSALVQAIARRWTPTARTMGALVVAAFCLVIAGPNLPTALLPAYRETYRMSPFGLSLLFSAYLLLLVPGLALCTRPAIRSRAGLLLIAGLSAALVADLLMATGGTPSMLVAGRALSGISVAISTGAAAALMVGLVGERGRGSVATGNIAGALFGTVAAVVLAQAGIGPVIYLAHAGVTVLVLGAVIAALAARAASRSAASRAVVSTSGAIGSEVDDAGLLNASSVSSTPPADATPTAEPGLIRRHVLLGMAVGALGWTVPGLVTALVPALLRQFTGPTAVVVATSPAILLLASAWVLQVLAKRPVLKFARGYELTIGTAMAGLGLAFLTIGALSASLPLVYVGCAVAAGGPALGYRGGMVLLTRGLDPSRQGAVTSRYAATSYGVSAVVVVGCGAIGAVGGLVSAVAIGAGVLVVVAIALLATILITEAR